MSPPSKSLPPADAGSSWPPRFLSPVPEADLVRSRGDFTADFIGTCCRITKDSVAGSAGTLIEVRDWQRALLRGLFAVRADGRLRHRQALIGMPRKNGKSALGAGIGLDGLMFGPAGGEVYSAAGDREQARIVFGTAKRMVELDPDLSEHLKLYRDVIEYPKTGSIYRCLSAEAYTKEGLNPTLVLFDEVHVQPNRELWDVMALATGARLEPLMVGITTAGVRTDTTGQDSLCYWLYQYGRKVAAGEVEDPTFYFAWWQADDGADHRNPSTWLGCNPGFGDLVAQEDFESAINRTPENEFRIKRCNEWVASATAWLPTGSWEACDTSVVLDGWDSEVILGFDGSFSNDSTALVVCTIGDVPHLDVVAVWERPPEEPEWRVDFDEVEAVLREAFLRFQVRECVFDPRIWQQLMERLSDEGYPMVEMPQGAQMVGAAQRFYEAVVNGRLTHSGNPTLARHIANAVLKLGPQGPRVVKETPGSPRKIDLAVAAIMAHDRAFESTDLTPSVYFA